MYKACIFDLDGTLLDTVESIAYSANRALKKCGFSEHPIEEYKMFAGDGQLELIRRCVKASGGNNATDVDNVMKEYIKLFKNDCLYHVKPYEGITELLRELKNHDIKVNVLSNKAHINVIYIIDEIFGKDSFDIVMGQQESIERKPSPEGALIIAERLNVKPEECIYIGDTNTDMKTGKSAGMYTIGVTWGFRDYEELREQQPDGIIDKPEEILSIL